MAASYAGLYRRLKDRTTCIVDKLKLVKFAWKSDVVHIPNKEQILLDLVTGFLVNKKKHSVSEDDVPLLWRCLHDILRSKKAHSVNQYGQSLIIKPSTCQLINDYLLAETKHSRSDSVISDAIGCCHAITTSPNLSFVFTSKYDEMVSVLFAVCQLVKKRLSDEVPLTDMLIQLLKCVTEAYDTSQRIQPNQKHVLLMTCDKLLVSVVSLWSLSRECSLNSTNESSFSSECLSSTVEKLLQAALHGLCHRDHEGAYNLYLSIVAVDEGNKQKPKSIDNVFIVLQKMVADKNSAMQSAAVSCIPEFYKGFVSIQRPSDASAHKMFVNLCGLIGLKADRTALCGVLPESLVIKGVNHLLRYTHEMDIYNVAQDNATEGTQLTFYKYVLSWLLTCSRTSSWFDCLDTMLLLNHSILEPRLVDVLTNCWLDRSETTSQDVERNIGSLLSNLTTMYTKLRQLSKWVDKILTAIRESKGTSQLHIPKEFRDRFAESVQVQPQGVMIDIWRKLNDAVKLHINEIKDDSSKQYHVSAVCQLLHVFLLNVKIADYSITEITSKSVEELMTSMSSECLHPLVDVVLSIRNIDDVVLLRSVMLLCYTYAELRLLLNRYKMDAVNMGDRRQPCVHVSDAVNMSDRQQPCVHVSDAVNMSDRQQPCVHVSDAVNMSDRQQPCVHVSDFSLLCSHIHAKSWKKLHQRIDASDDPMSMLLFNHLLLQRLRAQKCTAENQVAVNESIIQESLELIMSFPEQRDVKIWNATWNGTITDIDSNSFLVAKWQMILENATVLLPLCSQEQTTRLSEFLVATQENPDKGSSEALFSLHSITESLTSSILFCELSGLHSSIISAVWRRMQRELFTRKRVKEKRKSEQNKVIRSVLEILSSEPEESESSLQVKLSHHVSEVLASQDLHERQQIPIDSIFKCLQILECLPIEYLSTVDQCRMFFGLVISVSMSASFVFEPGLLKSDCLIKETTECKTNLTVIEKTLSLLTALLDASGHCHFFRLLEVKEFLAWLEVLYVHFGQQSAVPRPRQQGPSPLQDQLRHVVRLVIRFAVWDYDVLQNMDGLVKQLCKEPKKVADDNLTRNHHKADFTIYKISMFLNQWNRLPLQSYVKDDICEKCKCFFNRTAAATMKSLCILFEGGIDVPTTTLAGVLSIYSIVLIFCCHGDNKTETSDHKLMQIAKDHFQHAFRNAIEILQGCDTISSEETTSALHFMETCCRYASKLNLINSDNKSGIWTALMTQLSHRAVNDYSANDLKVDHTNRSTFYKPQEKPSCFKDLAAPMSWEGVVEHRLSSSDLYVRKQCFARHAFERYRESHTTSTIDKTSSSSLPSHVSAIQNAMAMLITTWNQQEIESIVSDLISKMDPDLLPVKPHSVLTAVVVWEQLIQCPTMTESQSLVLSKAAHSVLMTMQFLLQSLETSAANEVFGNLTSCILRAEAKMLSFGPSFLPPQSSVICLHGCHFTSLVGLPADRFVSLFHGVYGVLTALALHHEDAVLSVISTFIDCSRLLMTAIIQEGSQDKIVNMPSVTANMIGCAHLVDRLFVLIAEHKAEFGKVAVYLVADYVNEIQKVTMLPAIKKALIPAIYHLLDICDVHSIAMLHTVLNSGVKEVFRLLYDDYTKYHKYQGKI